jgi:hypothetical protein
VEAVIVALIGVVGSVLVVLVEKGRKENARDHGVVADRLESVKIMLENIDEDVMHIESKLDNHLSDHSRFGGFDIDNISFKTGEKVKDKKGVKVNKYGSKKR